MNHKAKILLLIVFVGLLAACKKYETYPVDRVEITSIFDKNDSAGTNAQSFLLDVYRKLKDGHNRVDGDYLDVATDDAVASRGASTQITSLAIKDGISALTMPNEENCWAYYYQGIRKATIFVNNIEVVPTQVTENGVSQKFVWKAEARFLRAYYYFELLKRYGGVPLLGDKVYGIEDDIALPRNSFEECVNYIVSECDAIKGTLLPVLSDANAHRVSQGAALALKSKVLLYAASPLYNRPDGSNSNPLLGYINYNAARWATAATAANDLIALNRYSLIQNNINSGDPHASLYGLKQVFITQQNKELIFIRMSDNDRGASTRVETNNAPPGLASPQGSGSTSPTQELVESFPMISGIAINEPGSNFNAIAPYDNRDPRLNITVFHNGSDWLGEKNVETFEDGRSKPNGTLTQTRTSYYLHKFMGNFEYATQFANHPDDWVLFRYAEILLNYAEAQNEAVAAPTPAVYDMIYQLRARAGINETTAGFAGRYGLKANMTKAEMRTVIRNERRIEMAFEESRYFDIRRWMTAETVMNQPRKGLSIVRVGDGFSYNEITALVTFFDKSKMYYYPIPYLEVKKNRNMVQNPGW
jgi:hypothetical protein